ncbi:MAG: ATP-grasp domain-containing protein [Bryobacteraceae bacterium]
MTSKRLLLLAATTGYQTQMFAEAASALGLNVVMATDRCHVLNDPWGDHAVPVRFEQPENAAIELSRLSPPIDALVAIGDRPTTIAALTAQRLGIPYHSIEAVEASRNKFLARERFGAAGLPVPRFVRVPLERPSNPIGYPCVLKPLGLSGSRGVVRANSEAEFVEAFARIRAILQNPEILRLAERQDRYIQVEEFVEGREFALEGIVTAGRLQTLAIFDKPDPLDGPYFEETIYVTPSREPDQQRLIDATQRAITGLGLTHGPIHAEMRLNHAGVWMLEVAARPIGGLCARALRFDGGAVSLEELILRHALGEDVGGLRREGAASGVMMIPIPQSGIYRGVQGVAKAAAIAEVVITAKEGQHLLRLPEGSSYLGFLFSRRSTPGEVEDDLRRAHAELQFDIARHLAVVR